jgi:carboxynorspermidine decarboxylase
MKKEQYAQLPSPCWLLDATRLQKNMQRFEDIKAQSGAKILLAIKGYALWKSFPLITPSLDGCCASGLHEAILGHRHFGKELHTYSPAFKSQEIDEIARYSHHLLFNSIHQFKTLAPKAKASNPNLSLGLRINPEYSHAPTAIYDPCGAYSRLGITLANIDEEVIDQCDGLHFHALCEASAEALESLLEHFESTFASYIPKMKWINFGGGHHITRSDYNIEKLITLLGSFKERYGVEVYLEPGEAVGWETGELIASVVDIVDNGMKIAILDTSAEAHMPDTLLMPYRPEVLGSDQPFVKPYTYRLAGNTCLAGDIMGDYSFDAPLQRGDRIVFLDQMHYTMVKATTFNGIPLPSIAIKGLDGEIEVVRNFGYKDFESRLC